MYRALAEGGTGLIVTGWAYVERSSRVRLTDVGMDTDGLIDPWQQTIQPAKEAGARVLLQIAHVGGIVVPDVNPSALSPSGISPLLISNKSFFR